MSLQISHFDLIFPCLPPIQRRVNVPGDLPIISTLLHSKCKAKKTQKLNFANWKRIYQIHVFLYLLVKIALDSTLMESNLTVRMSISWWRQTKNANQTNVFFLFISSTFPSLSTFLRLIDDAFCNFRGFHSYLSFSFVLLSSWSPCGFKKRDLSLRLKPLFL